MKLNDEEKAMLAGELGVVAKTAIEHQIKVGTFFHAEDFVPVTQAHIMADTESLGQAGVVWLERLADARDGRVRIPTITDPRGRLIGTVDITRGSPEADFGALSLVTRCAHAIEHELFRRLSARAIFSLSWQPHPTEPAADLILAFGDDGEILATNEATRRFMGGDPCQGGGNTCLAGDEAPPAGFRRCIMSLRPEEASCPVEYPDKVSFFTELIDNRGCSPCTCTQTAQSECRAFVYACQSTSCDGGCNGGLVILSAGHCRASESQWTYRSVMATWLTNVPGVCTAGGGAP